MKTLPIKGQAIGGLNPINAAGSALSMLVEAYKDYNHIKQVETTKREMIKAQRDVAINRIQAQKEVLQNYLNNSFKERAQNFTKMFELLDEGLATGNDKIIGVAMNMIVEQVKANPLEGIAQLMSGNVIDQINDPNVESIEI